MKITALDYKIIHIPMKEPFKVTFAEIIASENVIVRLTAENGETGFGEASPFAPVTGESTASVTAALDVFRQGIIGMDVCDFEGVHAMMDHLTVGDTSAKCAVDIAMYDLLGKLTGLPVYKLLGGACHTVENDITIGINTPDKMAEAAERYVKEGFRILKIKIGINPDEDIEALSKIRKAVGPSIRLRVDANQGYTAQQAVDVIKKLKPIDVEAIEQCLPYWDIRGMAYVRDHASGIKVMADESLHSPHDAERIAREGAADVMNIKLMKSGGLYPALQINAIAEAAGITCMVGCMMETKIAITAGLSLVASRRNICDADCDSFMYSKDPEMGMPGGFTFSGSTFTLSDKPGLGLDIHF